MTFEWKLDRDANQGYLLKRGGSDRAIERELESLLGLN
jgi:hypothetical protein